MLGALLTVVALSLCFATSHYFETTHSPRMSRECVSKLFVWQMPKQVSAGLKPRCRGSAVAPIQ